MTDATDRAPLPDPGGVRPPGAARRARGGDARQAARCSSRTRRGPAPQAAREAWRAANGLQAHCGVEIGRLRLGLDADRAPTCCAPGSARTPPARVYAPLNLAARGSYLEHTINLAESKVLSRTAVSSSASSGSTCRTSRPVVLVGGDAPTSSSRGATITLERAARRRLRRAAGAAAAGRAVGRPQPDLHLRHDRPVEGRPRRARRVLELRATASSRRSSTRATATCSRCRCSTRPAPGSRTRCCSRAARSRIRAGFSAKTFWDDVRRFEATITIAIHGMVSVHARPAAVARTTPTTRCAPSTWGRSCAPQEFAERFGVSRLHRLRDDRGAGADRLRPRTRRTSAAAAAPPIPSTTSCGSSTSTTSRCRSARRAS